jgi:hypothetical protein
MAQLRDAHTSELIAEGTPLELAVLAEELGRDEVLFDGVGTEFDPDAVLDAARQRAAELDTVDTKEGRKAAKAAAAELEAPRELVDQAAGELEAARGRREV